MPNFEQPRASAEEYLGRIELVAYKEMVDSLLEQETILKNIHHVLTHAQDRREGEEYFLEVLGPRMEGAQKESQRALRDWLASTEESITQHEKTLNENDSFEEPPITHFG